MEIDELVRQLKQSGVLDADVKMLKDGLTIMLETVQEYDAYRTEQLAMELGCEIALAVRAIIAGREELDAAKYARMLLMVLILAARPDLISI